ncbi:MAG: phosphoserine transaminase [Proteobacteria bacterium]|nr:MAG: phosphoserine transaminase [Pseudomonadota bacterium]
MFETLKIPHELLPLDGRFGCGPSLVRPEFVEALARESKNYLGTSHRQPNVKNKVGGVIEKLRTFMKIPADYKIAMGNGSASLVWDACTFSLIEKKAAHFVNGEFSQKWSASTKESKFVDAHVVKVGNGEQPKFEEFADCDVHCITWNETSTGAMWDHCPTVKNSLLAVDATSAAGAYDWDLSKTDVFYFSPQKAFGSEGGLWIGIFSPKAVAQIERVKKSGRYIPAMLDLSLALKNGEANQTYNTPALATVYIIDKQLDWFLEKGGMAGMTAMADEKQKLLHTWVDRRPELSHYIKDPKARSKTVCTINLDPAIPFDQLTKQLRKQGVLDIDAYRNLGENQIRISLFPNISKEDLGKLTQCIDYLLDNRQAKGA